MQEIIQKCDSCGVVQESEIYTLMKHGVGINVILGDNRTPFDLCKDCFDVLCFKLDIKSFEKFPKITHKH